MAWKLLAPYFVPRKRKKQGFSLICVDLFVRENLCRILGERFTIPDNSANIGKS